MTRVEGGPLEKRCTTQSTQNSTRRTAQRSEGTLPGTVRGDHLASSMSSESVFRGSASSYGVSLQSPFGAGAEFRNAKQHADRLLAYYHASEEDGHLSEVIAAHAWALSLCSPGNEDYDAALGAQLGLFAELLTRVPKGPLDIDAFVTYASRRLESPHHNLPALVSSFVLSGKAHVIRSKSGTNSNDFQTGISHYQEALRLSPWLSKLRSLALSFLVEAYTCFSPSDDDVDKAVAYYKLMPRPEGGSLLAASTLHPLAHRLCDRFDRIGDIDDLSIGIDLLQWLLKLCPNEEDLRLKTLWTLADYQDKRHQKLHMPSDLDDRIHNLQELMNSPRCDPIRDTLSFLLAVALQERSTRDSRDPDGSTFAAYVDSQLEESQTHIQDKRCFSRMLAQRFQTSGDRADIEQCIMMRREIMEICRSDDKLIQDVVLELSDALRLRAEHSDETSDITAYVEHTRETQSLFSPGSPQYLVALELQAHALVKRSAYYDESDSEDLDAAVLHYEHSLSLQPPGSWRRCQTLYLLGVTFMARAMSTRSEDDIVAAISCQRRALATTRDEGMRKRVLLALNQALFSHCSLTKNHEILDECIQSFRDLESLGPGDGMAAARPEWVSYYLAGALLVRVKASGKMEDLAEATKRLAESLECSSQDSSLGGACLLQLGYAMTALRPGPRDANSFAEGILLLRRLVESPRFSPHGRYSASLFWIQAARTSRSPCLLEAYSSSLGLLHKSVSVNRTITGRRSSPIRNAALANARLRPADIPLDGAALAIAEDRLWLAVDLLEQGRAVALAHVGGYREPLRGLREANPHLAERFKELSLELERHTWNEGFGGVMLDPLGGIDVVGRFELKSTLYREGLMTLGRYEKATSEWEDVVAQIRNLSGFDDFLDRIPVAKMRAAARDGPIVLVNISDYRSNALIVTQARDPILVPLVDANPRAVLVIAASIHRAMAKSERSRPLSEQDSRRMIQDALRDAWEKIVGPIVDALESEIYLPATLESGGARPRVCGRYQSTRADRISRDKGIFRTDTFRHISPA